MLEIRQAKGTSHKNVNVLRLSYRYKYACGTRYGTGTGVALAILSDRSRNKMVVFVRRDNSEHQ